MSFTRVRAADWATGAAGLALLLLLWAGWYETPGLVLSAWESFAITDLVMALAALPAIALPVVTASARAPAVSVALGVVVAALTVIALLLLAPAFVNQPGSNGETSIRVGAWLGLACAIALLVASYFALRDERSPGIEPPGPFPVMSAPPAGSGPEPTAPPTVAT